MTSIVAILNPQAGGRQTAKAWAEIRPHLERPVQTLETRAPGHAIELTRLALKGGATTIIAVGGDGTINEVVNGFFENDRVISSEAALAIVPHGTGSDFVRILNLPREQTRLARTILEGVSSLVDVMKVAYTRMDGQDAFRYSLNVTSFGMGGAVAARANRSTKPLGGKAAFLAATIETAMAFAGNSVTLTLDGASMPDEKITNVAVGNGQFHGSGMWVCPDASIQDGLLNVTVIPRLSLFELLRNLPVLYNGQIYSHPKVKSYRAKFVQASSPDRVLIEIDGESLGRLPAAITILPQALRILTPSSLSP
jgi:YegS/Rv2252/BmrU family lipid kinase